MNFATDDPSLFDWMQNVTNQGAGHFLSGVVKAAFHADGSNAQLMYPLLKQLEQKYPNYNSPGLTPERPVVVLVLNTEQAQALVLALRSQWELSQVGEGSSDSEYIHLLCVGIEMKLSGELL